MVGALIIGVIILSQQRGVEGRENNCKDENC